MGMAVLKIGYAGNLKFLAQHYRGWDGKKDDKGRTLLQQLGTEKIRRRSPDYWVNVVIGVSEIFEDDFGYVVISDARFQNEINRWREEGYDVTTVYVERPNFDNGLTDEQKNHVSENALNDFPFDVRIFNTSLEDLANEIKNKVIPKLF